MNNVSLVGRLCADPELRYSTAGVAVCKFTLAVDRPFGKEKQADFLPCLCFKATAENTTNYLAKGSKAGVTGSIQTSTWEKDGVKHYKTEILADRVEFMDSKPKDSEDRPSTNPPASSFGHEVNIDGDIPF
jgi:single-strand DNA-binding protein